MGLFLPLLILLTFSLVSTRWKGHRDAGIIKEDRIIGGHFATIPDSPFVVSIVIRPRLRESKIKLLCGGVIIQKYWALTASHCLHLIPHKIITSKHIYIVGNTSSWDDDLFNPGKHYIEDYKTHENYLGILTDYDYDIALLKVRQPFNNTYERPITFAGSTYQYVEQSPATVYGWGVTDPNNDESMSPILKATTLMVTSFHECVRLHQSINRYVTPRMLCAWNRRTDSCGGDSGGPLVQDNTLIGLVSWGVTCASDDWPGVYTRVSEFSIWILNNIAKMEYQRHISAREIHKDLRIIKGHVSPISRSPFIVSLVYSPSLHDIRRQLLCAAVIIKKYWALTASHCLEPIPPQLISLKDVFLHGGTAYWNSSSCCNHYIEEYSIHEQYRGAETSYDNDIAIMRVKEPFDHTFEKPICFAGSTYPYVQKSEATVYGWGLTNVKINTSISTLLKATVLEITNFNACVNIHKSIGATVTPRMVCAFKLHTDSCTGDSGGPLVQDGILIGLVSWGVECASDSWPGIYTKISKFSDWILSKIKHAAAVLE